jgi:hypothetical protein
MTSDKNALIFADADVLAMSYTTPKLIIYLLPWKP